MSKNAKIYDRLTVLAELWDKPLRVSAYCRASYDGFRLQWQHYSNIVSAHPNWTFMGCYTGQKTTDKTDLCLGGFPQMLADCRAGKIDLILTKSLSSIKRNTEDCLRFVYRLSMMNPPVGIYIEDIGLYSLQSTGKFFLPFFLEMAIWESENKGKQIGCVALNDKSTLKTARMQKGLTQKEVAETANIAMRHYQMFECGKRDLANASFRVAMAVCRALDIEPKILLGEHPITKRTAAKGAEKSYNHTEE